MFYSKLLMLNRLLGDDEINALDIWLQSLSAAAKEVITVSKLANAIHIEYLKAQAVLEEMVAVNICKRLFAVKCPNCGCLIKKLQNESEFAAFSRDLDMCYSCEEAIDLSLDDVEVLYSLTIDNVPPTIKVLKNYDSNRGKKDSEIQAKIDGLNTLLESGYNIHNLFYNPSEQEREVLQTMYTKVFTPTKNTKEKGDTLENLVKYLFNLCAIFKTSGIKTQTNQIDCVVRHKFSGVNSKAMEYLGKLILIECKNEKTTPKGEYEQKLHDIMSIINNGTGLVTFGIICSIAKPPKTFVTLSNIYYLRDKAIIVALHKADFERIIIKNENLLDMLEEKIYTIITNSSSDLKVSGLF